MTGETRPPDGGQSRIDLAVQVANIAAQVSAAMKSADLDKRTDLENRLSLVQERLVGTQTPEELLAFIEVMRAVLAGRDASELTEELGRSFRAVYEQLIDELENPDTSDELTVGQVLQEVSHNVIQAMRFGTADHRRRMGNTLLEMAQEAERRPDLQALIDFLAAARLLLQDGDPTPAEAKLIGPFRSEWDKVLEAIEE